VEWKHKTSTLDDVLMSLTVYLLYLYSYSFIQEIIQNGIVILHIWMVLIYRLENALSLCIPGGSSSQQVDALLSWDQAAAVYTGYLQGSPGQGDGVLLYDLANRHCDYFRTCGEQANLDTGNSPVNIQIFAALSAGQKDINNGQCDAARNRKLDIERIMVIPLIQGTLLYSYLSDYNLSRDDQYNREYLDASGAIFAASILPLIHSCSPKDAQIVYDNMRVGLFDSDYPAVRAALERNYVCLGITCSQIGGLYEKSMGGYLGKAAPCSDAPSASNAGVVLGAVIGCLLAIGVLFYGYRHYCREKREKTIEFTAAEPYSDTPNHPSSPVSPTHTPPLSAFRAAPTKETEVI
jgi:hypothetical protein